MLSEVLVGSLKQARPCIYILVTETYSHMKSITEPTPSSHVKIWNYIISLFGCVSCVLLVLWTAFFVVGCVLIHRANVAPVHAACGTFWEFMVVALISPALIPVAYATIGLGAIAWQDFYAVASLALVIAALVMTLSAASNDLCREAIRATTPPEPWLIFFGWLKVVAYGAGTISALSSRTIVAVG